MNRILLASLMALFTSAALSQAHEPRRSGTANPRENATVAAAASVRTINFSGIAWTVKASNGELWGPVPVVATFAKAAPHSVVVSASKVRHASAPYPCDPAGIRRRKRLFASFFGWAVPVILAASPARFVAAFDRGFASTTGWPTWLANVVSLSCGISQ